MPFTRIAQHSLVQNGSRAETADIAVERRLARGRRHGALQVAGTLSEVGDQPPLLSLSGAVLALGLATGNAQRAQTGARMLAAVVVATGIKSVLKHFVSRTRPHVLLDEGRYAVQAFGPEGPGNRSPPATRPGVLRQLVPWRAPIRVRADLSTPGRPRSRWCSCPAASTTPLTGWQGRWWLWWPRPLWIERLSTGSNDFPLQAKI